MRKKQSPIDLYISQVFAKETVLMQKAKMSSQKINKESISVSAVEGALLGFLVRLHGSKKVVELGTLTGYSALWLLSAMPELGTLWTFEKSSDIARSAEEIFHEYRSNSRQTIHLLVGDAEENLKLIEKEGAFDAVFIDANKAAYGRYLEWSIENLRSGGLLMADNVLLGGDVINDDFFPEGSPHSGSGVFSEKQVRIMRDFNLRLGSQVEFFSTLLPTSEGLAVGIKK